jgi:hypothetical protein
VYGQREKGIQETGNQTLAYFPENLTGAFVVLSVGLSIFILGLPRRENHFDDS